MRIPTIGQGPKHAEQIIKQGAEEELKFIKDVAMALEDLMCEKGVKNNQVEPILKFYADRHQQRVMNMTLNDEVQQMKDFEYVEPKINNQPPAPAPAPAPAQFQQ